MEKQELQRLLNFYDDMYYNRDTNLISDEEYDSLKNQYVKLYGEYNYVPGKASSVFKKFKHTVVVTSLDKVKISEVEKLRAEIIRLWPITIQHKFDGLTLVIYPDGTMVTRGNGYEGEIVTENAKNITGLGDISLSNLPVRVEVVIHKDTFRDLNTKKISKGEKPFDSIRNAAAGILRRKDTSQVKGLIAYAYNFLYKEENNNNVEQLIALNDYGWNTTFHYEPKTVDEAMEFILGFDDAEREALPYAIDGLVIKHNGDKKFGFTKHHPKGAIAVKFLPKGEWTTVKKVYWTAGRTGKICANASFDPIHIDGSTIKKATLHNYNIMQAKNLTELRYDKNNNCITKIHVIKANDVIPEVDEVEQPKVYDHSIALEDIEVCPECGLPLDVKAIEKTCTNLDCPSKILNRIIHMADRQAFNITNLSEATAAKMIDWYIDKYEHAPEHPCFIFEMRYKDILSLEGFAEKSANDLYNNIQNSRNITFTNFLYGCGIPLIGRKAAEVISNFYNENGSSVENFVIDSCAGFKDLKKVKSIGSEMIKSLSNYYDNFILPFGDYVTFINEEKKTETKKDALRICVTGAFEIPREKIKEIIENAGHKFVNSVSSKTNLLLCNDHTTTKYKTAVEKGIKIISTVDELKEEINNE